MATSTEILNSASSMGAPLTLAGTLKGHDMFREAPTTLKRGSHDARPPLPRDVRILGERGSDGLARLARKFTNAIGYSTAWVTALAGRHPGGGAPMRASRFAARQDRR